MIRYQLKCAGQDGDHYHEFEGWFRNSADYDEQAEKGLLECPVCSSNDISKALMAPAIARSGSLSTSSQTEEKVAAFRQEYADAAKKARAYIEKNFDNVGKRFPEEARRIHYGETDKRAIFGEASGEEVRDLIDEGIEVAPVPAAPESAAETKKKMN